jgi:hypothetical protein
MSAFSLRAVLALRMRVNMSAIGSDNDIGVRSPYLIHLRELMRLRAARLRESRGKILPARLGYSRKPSLKGQVPEAYPANLELAQIPSGPSADPAPVVLPHAKFRFALGFCY